MMKTKNIMTAPQSVSLRNVRRIILREDENFIDEKLLGDTEQKRVFDLFFLGENGEKKFLSARKSGNDFELRNFIGRQKYGDTYQSYVNWMGEKDWTFFMTGTTPYELTDKSARRLAERYFLKLQPYCDGMFFVSEKFELKSGMHLHALMNCPYEAPFQTYFNFWQIATGNKPVFNDKGEITRWSGFGNENSTCARIQLKRYDPKLGAEGYCGKYCFKKRGDYDFFFTETLPKPEIIYDIKPQRVPKGFYRQPEDEDYPMDESEK